jgi:hypothetical protein
MDDEDNAARRRLGPAQAGSLYCRTVLAVLSPAHRLCRVFEERRNRAVAAV